MTGNERPNLKLTARCACGAVTIALAGRVASMFQCSCLDCQRATGTGHASVVLLPEAAVEVDGNTKSFSRPADSGAIFTRHFCPDCATTVFAQSSRAPGLRIIPVGLLAGDNSWFEPNQLIFARSHPIWDSVKEDMPRYATYRDGSKP